MTTASHTTTTVPGCGAALEVSERPKDRQHYAYGYDVRDAYHLANLPTMTPQGIMLCADCGDTYRTSQHIGVTVSNALATEGLTCGSKVKTTTPGKASVGHYPGCGANLARLPKSFAHISERPVGQWVSGEWQSGPVAAVKRSSANSWPTGTKTIVRYYDATWANAQGIPGDWGACGENLGRLPKSWQHISERPAGYWHRTGGPGTDEWVSQPRMATPSRARTTPQPRSAPPVATPVATDRKWDPELAARMWAMIHEIDQQHADIRHALAHR